MSGAARRTWALGPTGRGVARSAGRPGWAPPPARPRRRSRRSRPGGRAGSRPGAGPWPAGTDEVPACPSSDQGSGELAGGSLLDLDFNHLARSAPSALDHHALALPVAAVGPAELVHTFDQYRNAPAQPAGGLPGRDAPLELQQP